MASAEDATSPWLSASELLAGAHARQRATTGYGAARAASIPLLVLPATVGDHASLPTEVSAMLAAANVPESDVDAFREQLAASGTAPARIFALQKTLEALLAWATKALRDAPRFRVYVRKLEAVRASGVLVCFGVEDVSPADRDGFACVDAVDLLRLMFARVASRGADDGALRPEEEREEERQRRRHGDDDDDDDDDTSADGRAAPPWHIYVSGDGNGDSSADRAPEDAVLESPVDGGAVAEGTALEPEGGETARARRLARLERFGSKFHQLATAEVRERYDWLVRERPKPPDKSDTEWHALLRWAAAEECAEEAKASQNDELSQRVNAMLRQFGAAGNHLRARELPCGIVETKGAETQHVRACRECSAHAASTNPGRKRAAEYRAGAYFRKRLRESAHALSQHDHIAVFAYVRVHGENAATPAVEMHAPEDVSESESCREMMEVTRQLLGEAAGERSLKRLLARISRASAASAASPSAE